MATVNETAAAADRLHDALNAKVRDPRFGDERFALFEAIRLRVRDVMTKFAASPAHGASSARYDPAIAACDRAAGVVTQERPQPNQDRAPMIAACDQAVDAIRAVTSMGGLSLLRGALRLPTTETSAATAVPAPAAPPVGGLGGHRGAGPLAPPPAGVPTGTVGAPPPGNPATPWPPVGGAPPTGTLSGTPLASGKQTPSDPNYYQKLTNLFPAEGLALHGTGVALFSYANAFVVLGALFVVLALRWIAYQPGRGRPTSYLAVGAAVVSYLLWATAGDPGWLADLGAIETAQADAVRRGAAFVGAAVALLAPAVVKTG